MAWQLLIQCTVKLIQKWKCKIRTFVFFNWKAKLPAFQNTFTAKLLHGEGQAPRSCTVLSTAVPLRGTQPWLWLFHVTSPSNRTFCLFSSCSGAARYSYCRCTDCSPLNTVVLLECVPLSGSYVTLKPLVLPMTWKLEEFIALQTKIMKHHMKAFLWSTTCSP